VQSSIDIVDILKLAFSVLAVVIPALWALSSKLSKVEGSIGELNTKLDSVEKDFVVVHKELAELNALCEKLDSIDRNGRKELWQEINSARERLTVVETKMSKNSK
jgi:chromosome segregation ATPase